MKIDATDATLGRPLELIAEMTGEFARSKNLETTLHAALARIAEYVGAESGSIFVLEDEHRALVCRASVGPVDIAGLRLAPGQGIVGRCVAEAAGQIVRDVRHDPDFAQHVDEQTGFTTRSILCAPMRVRDESFGAIELLNKKGGDGLFDPDDQHLLEALATSAALAILNARMAANLMEQERIQRELDLAAEIQKSMLPPERTDAFPVSGRNVPARGVSGDFYDFFELPDGCIRFCIGDVSGKGMNAAMLMAKTSSLHRCLGKSDDGPGRLLDVLNREICETATRGMFVTMVTGLYDPRADAVCLANAGHEPPLLRDAEGKFRAIAGLDPPLGILPRSDEGAGFEEARVALEGGGLLLFTDGATEALDDRGEELGSPGVAQLFRGRPGARLADHLDRVVDHLADRGLRDDLTFLAVESVWGGGEE